MPKMNIAAIKNKSRSLRDKTAVVLQKLEMVW